MGCSANRTAERLSYHQLYSALFASFCWRKVSLTMGLYEPNYPVINASY